MCGLAGLFIARRMAPDELRGIAKAMADTIVHRGPDDEGTFADASGSAAFGFRRLSILDLSPAGHQPMVSKSGRYTLAFNGEIYNHLEVREQLKDRAHPFRGHSDTETILEAFDQWGIRDTVGRLAGMFAMSVWDAERRELSLVRDRLGKKPLYIYRAPGTLAFASELRALRVVPGFAVTVDPAALALYLRFLYVPAPHSIFTEVRKLRPGHVLTVGSPDAPQRDGWSYWSPREAASRSKLAPWSGSEAEATESLDTLLTDAVRGRMMADVPVGALLSGGIDSSLVVSMMCERWPSAVRTYSVAFPEKEFNEAAHARDIARHLGSVHTTFDLTAQDLLGVVPKLPEIFDEPLADPSQVPTYLISALSRRDVTVALTGDGGDEVFGGYNRYVRGSGMLRAANAIPLAVRRRLPAAGGRYAFALVRALGIGGTQQSPSVRADKLRRLLQRPTVGGMYEELLSTWSAVDGLVSGLNGGPHPDDPTFGLPGAPLSESMMLFDQGHYLPDDLLAKLDRASMAVSLEARCPILDHRVVEFAWRLPIEMKIRAGSGKWILRRLLEKRVPRAMFERPKMGFSAPIAGWLRGPLRSWADDLLLDDSLRHGSSLAASPVSGALRAFQAGDDALAPLIWALCVYRAWESRWCGAGRTTTEAGKSA